MKKIDVKEIKMRGCNVIFLHKKQKRVKLIILKNSQKEKEVEKRSVAQCVKLKINRWIKEE